MHGRLNEKIAVVTGGGRGIGAAIAQRFCEEGAKVAIFEIDPEGGRATAREISKLGYLCKFYEVDVTKPHKIDEAVQAVEADIGPIDVLVNNAGANVFYEPLLMPDDEWDRCLRLDLDAAWYCSRAVIPGMLRHESGSIINIGSTHSFKIIPHAFPYPVAKHGLIGLTRSLGIEYARSGIRVNAIAPGYIETQLAVDYWSEFPNPEAERSKVYDLHPPGRIGKPVEVANTALFLASDEATFINAETITIDGGRSQLYHE